MAEDTVVKPKRGRGRPPKKEGSEHTSTAILDAAIRLFSLQGVQATSMSQIAREAGYDQSSLYYWYKSKEEILTAILKNDETTRSLQYATRIVSQDGDKHAQLYAILYNDMITLCASPFDFYDLEMVALSSEEFLQPFFDTHQQLSDIVAKLIDDGITEKVFDKVKAADIALDALALHEGLQHRYHMNNRSTLRNVDGISHPLLESMEKLAHHAASKTLLSVAPKCNPEKVRQNAIGSKWIDVK